MKNRRYMICAAVIFCCIAMGIVDGLLQPPYAVKSAIKIVLFLVVPMGVCAACKSSAFAVFRPDRNAILLGLGLGIGTFGVIIGGYTLLQPFLDLSAIPDSLAKSGISADNFLFVGLYIALCNSMLEEFFFRGFAYISLKRSISGVAANLFSAVAFAVYHAAFMDGWFSPALFILLLAALFACGLFFNFLNARRERIWVSWLVHMFANLAINAIGMKLLGMF